MVDSEHYYYNRRKEDTRDRILEPHVVTIHKTETGFGFNVRGQVSGRKYVIDRGWTLYFVMSKLSQFKSHVILDSDCDSSWGRLLLRKTIEVLCCVQVR